VPPEESKPLFLQFAQLEEKHGLARSAMEVYDRAVRTVPEAERLPVYDLYLARASESFGIGKVREIYETAIEAQPPYNLTDADCKTMCIRWAGVNLIIPE
jgi:pre-mRNA-splicing factor SYF1